MQSTQITSALSNAVSFDVGRNLITLFLSFDEIIEWPMYVKEKLKWKLCYFTIGDSYRFDANNPV